VSHFRCMKKSATQAAFTAASEKSTTTTSVLCPRTYATPTSRTVSTKSTKKMVRYWRARDPVPWAAACAGVSVICSSRGNQVHDGEDQDPDQVHEVPEQAEQLDLRGRRLPPQPAHQRDQDVEGAGEDVRAVEAGDHVEGARVRALAEHQALLRQPGMEDAEVLVVLAEKEERAAQRGEAEKDCRPLALIVQRCLVREDHADAGADEQERQPCREGDPQLRLARVPPDEALAAEDPVREKEAGERQPVGDEEDPHGDLPRARAAELGVLRPDDFACCVPVRCCCLHLLPRGKAEQVL